MDLGFRLRKALNPTQMVISTFALVIVLGTILLSTPFATASGERMPLVDAFFTIVSATCVTGLAVVDTGTYFSTFGQIVILVCIQIGGLGLMAFTSVFVVALGNRMAIADRLAIQQTFHHTPVSNIRQLLKYIVLATFMTEAFAAALLTIHWSWQGRFAGIGETIYHAVFHSISAFCNAGFSLNADSLVGYNSDPITILTTSFLIIAGGIGFLVFLDTKLYIQGRISSVLPIGRGRDRNQNAKRSRLSIHSKVVLIVTFSLLIIGTFSYYLLERNGVFAEMSTGTAWLNAFFGSVTARTAGFNSIDYGGMNGAALLCTIVLMFIGASPGSSGGGVKTSTFGVLIAYSITRLLGHKHLNVFGRTIPQLTIDRAAGIVILSVALLILAASFLIAFETNEMQVKESQGIFLTLVFETVSAFATVGLSMGYTAELGSAGKIVLAVVMFLGRIGPLTLALAISRRKNDGHFRFAEENLMVG